LISIKRVPAHAAACGDRQPFLRRVKDNGINFRQIYA
jgi:hypothetical protein